MMEITHPPDECLRTLELLAERDDSLLENVWWGCGADEHTGWLLVRADSASEALSILPPAVVDNTAISEVRKCRADEVEDMHEHAA